MTNILTVDQAFNDSNFEQLEDALFELNKAGVYDSNFLPLVQNYIDSRDSSANFNELKFEETQTKISIN